MSDTVAFVGLGAMGAGMAACLLRHGLAVRGFDVRPEPAQALAGLGGQACRSSAEAAEAADLAVVIVLNADQVEQAVFGEDGLARSLRAGTPIVSMSTMSPGRARALASQAAERGLRWLDAPVSGGVERARGGHVDPSTT